MAIPFHIPLARKSTDLERQNKFSIPQCKPFDDDGRVCRPGKPITLNTTLVYPGGSEVELADVHVMFCFCGYGLTCNPVDDVCRNEGQQLGFNSLMGESNYPDD